ncbi:MAG: RNA-binding protein [Ruminococcus sp.]|nr:RNA-binding protein [Ruminococcus sp.]
MNEPEDKLFYARLSDMLSRCERDCCAQFSSFLDERQCALAEEWCSRNRGELCSVLWGGYPDARRRMLAIYPEYCQEYILDEFLMRCVTFSFRKEDKLTHRDLLGTFMGMMLKRDTIGDIIVTEGAAQTFVTDVAAKVITGSVSKVGRVGVKVSDDRPFELELKQEFEDIKGTVASMRLDCIVSLAAKVSRENAARLIRSEKVDINHFTASSVSAELREGDVLSIRGSGRFILSGIDGETKKGRIHINLRKYI